MTSHASRTLRIAGWSNITIAACHVVGLIWAWSVFRAVGIEPEMRELAMQGVALPYILTLVAAAAFLLCGLYALSGAGDLRRLPFLRTALLSLAVIYLYRATIYGGSDAVRAGDGAQIAFAAIALLIGLCYAHGAVARLRVSADPPAGRVDGRVQTRRGAV